MRISLFILLIIISNHSFSDIKNNSIIATHPQNHFFKAKDYISHYAQQFISALSWHSNINDSNATSNNLILLNCEHDDRINQSCYSSITTKNYYYAGLVPQRVSEDIDFTYYPNEFTNIAIGFSLREEKKIAVITVYSGTSCALPENLHPTRYITQRDTDHELSFHKDKKPFDMHSHLVYKLEELSILENLIEHLFLDCWKSNRENFELHYEQFMHSKRKFKHLRTENTLFFPNGTIAKRNFHNPTTSSPF